MGEPDLILAVVWRLAQRAIAGTAPCVAGPRIVAMGRGSERVPLRFVRGVLPVGLTAAARQAAALGVHDAFQRIDLFVDVHAGTHFPPSGRLPLRSGCLSAVSKDTQP